MAIQYLRNKVDGTIYEWHPILAANPKCEPITEEQAFPERFAPKAVIAKVKASKRKPIDLSGGLERLGAGGSTSPELAADAARGIEK